MPIDPIGADGPLVLAVDTTSEFGSIALVRGGSVLEETALHEPSGFSHVLYGHLDALLRRHDVPVGGIDLFAAASGPGSFTGVRVGLACIKGLAEATAKPAAAVSNLQALAAFGTAALRAPVIDARRGDVYAAVYDAAGRLVSPEIVGRFDAWLRGIPPEAELIATASNFAPAPLAFKQTVAPRSAAAAIGRIAAERLRRGEACDPAALDANYVRRSDAELFWKE